MHYKVLKSGCDGISGSDSCYVSIDEACCQVPYFQGWGSLEQIHLAISKWARTAKPGDLFVVGATVIIAVRSRDREENCCLQCGFPYYPVGVTYNHETDGGVCRSEGVH